MLKKIKTIVSLSIFFIFFILITNYYFSDQNIKLTNKARSTYVIKTKYDISNLPLLKNDTNDIIEYRDDIEIYKKNKKKYTFWDLLNNK